MSLPTPTLHTARLRLRPFTDADEDALFTLHSNAHVLRYWDSPPWTEPARAARFVEKCRTRQAGSPLFGPACAGSNTYYVNFQGDSPLRPALYAEMWWENRHFPLSHYRYASPVREPALSGAGGLTHA